jgi:hypothetical protein
MGGVKGARPFGITIISPALGTLMGIAQRDLAAARQPLAQAR